MILAPAHTALADRFVQLADRFARVRRFTERICDPLCTEDYVIQTMPDVSPAKWHLAHTTWFFEKFILAEHDRAYEPVNPAYDFLFNSYYNAVGPQHCRPNRGHLSRPTVAEVYDYRRRVNQRLVGALPSLSSDLLDRIELGLHHEQQHQELLITDLKYNFSTNPLLPAYRPPQQKPTHADAEQSEASGPAAQWVSFDAGLADIGLSADHAGFAYDNETPRHRVYLEPFSLASRLVTNSEYQRFIDDGGYDRAELWLSLGWATVQKEGWRHPLYWFRGGRDGIAEGWHQYTLSGALPLVGDEPVCHLSYFEADAFARWAGARLPTEQEWEHAATASDWHAGRFAEDGILDATQPAPHPARVCEAINGGFDQLFGSLWEWTSSSYSPYPGYKPLPGALGEYNGKFMCNQYVLRGGSCATPRDHIRATYRNFFGPESRWQFTGLRLARSAENTASAD